ncbi:MAG: right-handed parallel beta-helix repeat-containing protein, partial [Mucilaginibacter sp.]
TISDNIIDGNETLAHGIAMITHGSGTLISKNIIKNCLRYGIVVYNSAYEPNTLKNNTIVYNRVENIGNPRKESPFGMGIYLMECQHSVVKGNHVSNVLINTDRSEILPPGAISLNGSANCLVDSNIIENSNKYGITLSQSFNSPVTNNSITNTGESGIYLMNTSNNVISNNTLKGINKYIIKGFFVNTGKKGFDWLNLDEYKKVRTGESIEIKNNTFYSNSGDETAISMKGDVADASKNGVDNKIRGVNIHDNEFHLKQRSANFIHYEQEEGSSNKAFNNRVVQE